jgi:hypothetical protein
MRAIEIVVLVSFGAASCGQAPTSYSDDPSDTAAVLPVDATCSELDAWLAAHPEAVPSDLDGLSKLPLHHRPRVFAALDPFARATIAADVVDRRLRTGELDARQIALLRRLRALATPEAFTEVNLPATRQTVALWRRDAADVLSDSELRDLFSGLGPSLPPTKPLSGSGTGCGCSIESDFCSTGMACAGGICEGSSLGCGWFFLYPCNGICAYIKNPGRPWGPPVPG